MFSTYLEDEDTSLGSDLFNTIGKSFTNLVGSAANNLGDALQNKVVPIWVDKLAEDLSPKNREAITNQGVSTIATPTASTGSQNLVLDFWGQSFSLSPMLLIAAAAVVGIIIMQR